VSDPNEPTTLGAYLREARRRKRVSLERAAEQTRIRADFLMRMESDDFDFLAPAYVRGFLSSYARFLGVPVETLLEEFDHRFGTGRVDTAQMIALDRKRSRAPGERRFGPVAIVLFAAAGLLLLFAVIGLAQGDDEDEPGRVAINQTRRPSPTATPKPTPTESEEPSPTPTITMTPPAEETASPLPEGAIEFQVVAARGECWVEVDVDGATVAAETLAEGDFRFFSADENEEMTVTLGAPGAVDLFLNGEELPEQEGSQPITFTLPDQADLIGA
jgi:cytoskeleton protein RodZ